MKPLNDTDAALWRAGLMFMEYRQAQGKQPLRALALGYMAGSEISKATQAMQSDPAQVWRRC